MLEFLNPLHFAAAEDSPVTSIRASACAFPPHRSGPGLIPAEPGARPYLGIRFFLLAGSNTPQCTSFRAAASVWSLLTGVNRRYHHPAR